jgi:hypothetical protein
LRHSHAFKLGSNNRRASAWSDRRQILEPQEVQGYGSAQEKSESDTHSHQKKESVRWLENLKQSTELLGEPERCVHIGDRESDIYELFCTGQELGTHFLVRTNLALTTTEMQLLDHLVPDKSEMPDRRSVCRHIVKPAFYSAIY